MPFQESDNARWIAETLQPHEAMLRAWLRNRFPDIEADDIVQDAYLRLLQAHERGEVRSAKALFFTTARNLAFDQLRRRRIARAEPLVENDALSVLEGNDGIPETVARNQDLEILTEAIQSLPDRCRRVFTLRKVYGMSQGEIAARLGISEHTVSAQLTIGLRKCTEFVARRLGGREGAP